MSELGERVGLHPTDGRRLRTSIVVLAVAAVALSIGVPLTIWHFTAPWGTAEQAASRRSFSQFIGAVTALGVMALVIGVPRLVKALRSRGESFELRERGVVHRVGETVTAVDWRDVASVRTRGVETSTGLAHAMGTDFNCTVRLTDGRRFRFTSYTANASELAAAIDAGRRSGEVQRGGTSGSPPLPGGCRRGQPAGARGDVRDR